MRHATAYKPEPARYVDKMSTSVPTVLLIQAIKRNPILWDSRLEEYKLSERKPAVWESIALEFGTSRSEYHRFLIIGSGHYSVELIMAA